MPFLDSYTARSLIAGTGMRRRKFIGLVGGAAAWPLAARAQPAANLPLVAVIGMSTEQVVTARSASIREGLKQAGLIEGKVSIGVQI